MKSHARELAPFISESGSIIGLLEMIGRELDLLHLFSELGFRGETALSREDINARRQLMERERELGVVFEGEDQKTRALIRMSLTTRLSRLADLAEEVEQQYTRLKKHAR